MPLLSTTATTRPSCSSEASDRTAGCRMTPGCGTARPGRTTRRPRSRPRRPAGWLPWPLTPACTSSSSSAARDRTATSWETPGRGTVPRGTSRRAPRHRGPEPPPPWPTPGATSWSSSAAWGSRVRGPGRPSATPGCGQAMAGPPPQPRAGPVLRPGRGRPWRSIRPTERQCCSAVNRRPAPGRGCSTTRGSGPAKPGRGGRPGSARRLDSKP